MAVKTFDMEGSRELTLKVLQDLFGSNGIPDVTVRLWDGTCFPGGELRPVVMELKHPGALRAMLQPGTEIGLVEAYMFDDFDILGDSERVYSLGEALVEKTAGWSKKLSVARDLIRLPNIKKPRETRHGPAQLDGKRHSIERDRAAIAYHYNLSNEFYALILDERMVYSCAYFRSPQDSLAEAQTQKLEHICRKLRLRPGMRLLDIGCGWGGLVNYACEHYGVDATGITLSQPQVELANQRIQAKGLEGRARVLQKDYREIQDPDGFDALVSIGMFEHVGADMLPLYFQRAYGLLKPGGVFLNHGVARRAGDPGWLPESFSNAYIFPDGELLPISHTLRVAEETGFEVRDVESLREHYALTLRHWVRNLEARHDEALSYVDEPTYRAWRVGFSYPAYAYTTGTMNIYQALLLKQAENGSSGLPLTREDWYA